MIGAIEMAEPALPGARHGVGVPAGPAVKTIAVAGTSVATATARRRAGCKYLLAAPISLVIWATPAHLTDEYTHPAESRENAIPPFQPPTKGDGPAKYDRSARSSMCSVAVFDPSVATA